MYLSVLYAKISVDHLNSPLVNVNNKAIIKVKKKKSTDILKWVRRAKESL